jgi:hypothetical protein
MGVLPGDKAILTLYLQDHSDINCSSCNASEKGAECIFDALEQTEMLTPQLRLGFGYVINRSLHNLYVRHVVRMSKLEACND